MPPADRAYLRLAAKFTKWADYLALPATEADLENAQAELGVVFPDELKTWLRCFNGGEMRSGVPFYGVDKTSRYYMAPRHLGVSNNLRLHLIPIASDGCGNSFVLDTSQIKQQPVLFIEAIRGDEEGCVYASSLMSFLTIASKHYINRGKWVFDREKLLKLDPELEGIRGRQMIWEEDDD